MAGDTETGVTIIRLVKELDAGPIAAQESFLVSTDDDAGAVFERAGVVAVDLLDEVLAADEPVFRDQAGEPTYAEKITADDRRLDLERPARELVDHVRALSPHIGARAELHGRGVTVWRARVGRGRIVRAGRGAAGRWAAHGVRGMASRAATVSPARAAALDVLLRVFEDDAYADRALRTAAAGLDERDRALAQRLAYGAVQRVRTLDYAIETLGRRRVARLDPPVRAALRLGAYQLAFVDGVPRYAAVNESVELVRRAGLERAVAFTNAVLRRLADGIRTARRRRCPTRRRPRRRSRTRIRTGSRRPGGRTSGRTERAALMRAQNEPGATVVRLVDGEIDGAPDPDVPGAWHVDRVDERAIAEGRIWPQSAASQLVGLDASARGRASAPSTSVPRRAARRRCSPARSWRSR